MKYKTTNTVATWSSVTTLPMVPQGSGVVISLCIVKVLTVQVVLLIPTAVEALTAIP